MKGTSRENNSQEGGFLNFLRKLMKAALSLAESVLVPLGLNMAYKNQLFFNSIPSKFNPSLRRAGSSFFKHFQKL